MSGNNSRPPFTERDCKKCGETKPWDKYVVKKRENSNGWSTVRMCHECRKEKDRLYGLSRRHRRKPNICNVERNKYKSRWSWVHHRIFMIERWGNEPIVIFAYPSDIWRPTQGKDVIKNMTIIIRMDRPPIYTPINAIPIAKIRNGIVIVHPLCPSRWEWFHRMVEMILKGKNAQTTECQN